MADVKIKPKVISKQDEQPSLSKVQAHPNIVDEEEEVTDAQIPLGGQENTQETITPNIDLPDLGVLNSLLLDSSITEIMVNDTRNVMIEKNGSLAKTDIKIDTKEELNRITRNILDVTGGIISPDQPYLDLMLPGGSRVNITASPLVSSGTCITIRKHSKKLKIERLIQAGALDQRMAYFLNVCVVGKLNILISGGTGSGKTTLLNTLCSFIPKSERVITIEETPEIILNHENKVMMQTKPQTPTSPAITESDLLANALRMRPDRIIVGECRRGEALDMLQAMNTGHEGSMTTIHANSTRDGISRLETLCLLSGVELPLLAIKKQAASALDLVIQIKRFRNGKRRITNISEISGIENNVITMQEIFTFELDNSDPTKPDSGRFKTTGFVPKFIETLRKEGIDFPKNYFG